PLAVLPTLSSQKASIDKVPALPEQHQKAPLAVPPTLLFQKAPVDKVPVLPVQHQVLNQFEIPLVESEEDPASPQEIPR
nr:hypothetical protein [Tanacetum cinerariifolium]